MQVAGDHAKHLIDGISISIVLGTIADILPAIAAFLSIIWAMIRIWETATVQSVVDPVFREHRRQQRLAVIEQIKKLEKSNELPS